MSCQPTQSNSGGESRSLALPGVALKCSLVPKAYCRSFVRILPHLLPRQHCQSAGPPTRGLSVLLQVEAVCHLQHKTFQLAERGDRLFYDGGTAGKLVNSALQVDISVGKPWGTIITK